MAWHDVLDWEESVFKGLLHGWRRLTGGGSDPSAPGMGFEDLHERLSVLAQLLVGEPVRLRAAPGVGGWRGGDWLLPEHGFDGLEADGDADAYRVQVVVLAGMHRLGLGRGAASASSYEGALEALRCSRRAVERMAAQLPGFRALHDRVMDRVLAARRVDLARLPEREALLEQARRQALRGEQPWRDTALRARLVGERSGRRRSPALPVWGEWLDAPGELSAAAPGNEPPPSSESPTTEIPAPPVAGLRRVDLEEAEAKDSPPSAPFERAETLDSYRGGRRDLDGSDELEAHLDALKNVELGDLLRSQQTTGSLLKMDLELAGDVADAEELATPGIPYDEWDARRARYRSGWCTVYPQTARIGDGRWAAEALTKQRPLVRRLRRRLEAHRAGLRPSPRQLDGEEVDLEAALAERIANLAGRGGDPRLYVRQERHRRDFATLVLLDASLSSDSWIDGRRILDVAREATLVLGEVAHEVGDRLQILAFASETRHRCLVWSLLADGEDWSVGKRRLGALEPRGYTRIGPALRHATALLSATPAERRLLLLISDGKPTDYDRYEGRYGVADVRQAIREAHEREIHAHALAIDAVARDYMPALFGRGGFHLLAQPEQLVEALTTVYGRLTKQ